MASGDRHVARHGARLLSALLMAVVKRVHWEPRLSLDPSLGARVRRPNRGGAGLTPAPPTPPDVRVRIRRFASRPGNGGRGR